MADGTLAVTGAKNFAEAGGKATSKAAKRGFLNTAAGKAAAAVLGVSIAGGAVFYGVSQTNIKEHRPETNDTGTEKRKR